LTKHSYNTKKPISRSYYKLWEIAHDFKLLNYHNKYDQTTSVHLAEGPGGFIESLCDMYTKNKYSSDKHTIYGITLLSSNSSIPNWKISENYMKRFKINLHKSTNGDLYKMSTIDTFISEFNNTKAELITADGGFDFSEDFNSQELQFQCLMLSQIYCAVNIQRKSGSFLMKVFDLFSHNSIILIAICSQFYRTFTIVKPKTSRPANSEKYILFQDYQDDEMVDFSELTSLLKDSIIKQDLDVLRVIIDKPYYKKVYETISLYNIVYTVRQVLCLKETITLNKYNTDKNELLRQNLLECKKWRDEYNLL